MTFQRDEGHGMHRILMAVCLLTTALALAFSWPFADSAVPLQRDSASQSVRPKMRDEPVMPPTTNQPLPHPALLAMGQLLVSVYALVAGNED